MDHNVNKKRKLSQSKEYERDFKRKSTANEKSTSCFGRCCSRKKHPITSIKKIPLEKENINHQLKQILPIQSASMRKVSNIPMRQLTQSPLYNEPIFCQKTLESYEDPCIECKVQYGPDIWENIPENIQHSRKQLYDNNQVDHIKIHFWYILLPCKSSDSQQKYLDTAYIFDDKTL